MLKLINVKVNGRSIKVLKETTVLQAIKIAGASVPTLCFNGRFPAKATCRLCLVETNKSNKWLPACASTIDQDIEITTDSPALDEYRKKELSLLLSRHPNECMTCMVSGGNCQLQNHVVEMDAQEEWDKSVRDGKPHGLRLHDHPSLSEDLYSHPVKDYTSPCIERDMRKCIECGLCVQACGSMGQNINAIGFAERGGDMLPVTVFDRPLKETPCIDCGQCTNICPTGAIVEHQDWKRVLKELDSRRRKLIVQVAPATRVAISEEFGMTPGTISTGRLINGLRKLGFDLVFDTNFTADLTIMEEGNELLERIKSKGTLPLMTSCCPGWINYVEKSHPELIPHLSSAKSPQQMHGALSRKFYGPDALVVSIMPCTAKKGEAVRPGMTGDVDAVLTTRELGKMFRLRDIAFSELSNEANFDSPLGESTGAAVIFGATGGVLEAALRTALDLLKIEAPIDFKSVRGFERVKECKIEGLGTVCAVNGISTVQKLFEEDPNWYKKYLMVEVMACNGGCLGGGGEPKFSDPTTLAMRMKGLYTLDERATKRKSHENADVMKLYQDHLGKPLSDEAHKLLHTTYFARHSKREMLAKFLDAVDQRDYFKARILFEEDGIWKTNSPFGTIQRNLIKSIFTKLPPAGARHRIKGPDGLTVVDATGKLVHFQIDVGPNNLIQRIERFDGHE